MGEYNRKFKDCADKLDKPTEWLTGLEKGQCPPSACPPKPAPAPVPLHLAANEESVREIVELATQELNQTSAKAISSVLALVAMSIVSFGVVLRLCKRRRSEATTNNY